MSNLVKEILDKFAEQLQKDIDNDIMRILFGESYELKIGTSTLYNDVVYHTAIPEWTPSRHGWYNQEWNDMVDWCVNMFGPSSEDGVEHYMRGAPSVWTPKERWYANNSKFWFRDEADLLMFVLRWS